MTIFHDPVAAVADRNGMPLPGASYSFFAGATEVPLTVYRDAARTQPHGLSIPTDLAGRRPVIVLPAATLAVPTYRVVCRDGGGATIFEARDLPLPAASTSSTAGTTFAAPALAETTDGGAISVTLTAATMAGLLSVNASAANITVVLPAFASLVDGQSAVVRQIGSGAAVIVRPAIGEPAIDGNAAWPLRAQGEQVTIVRGAGAFAALSDTLAAPVVLVESRPSVPPALPGAGQLYLAAAASGVWAANRLYRADGLGGWIDVPRRIGMLALVAGESIGGSPRPYCWSGTAWVPWTPVAATSEVIAVEHQQPSGTPGGVPATGAWTRTDLNTVVANTLSGASLSGGGVSLPAGTYDITAWRFLLGTGASAVRVWAPALNDGVRGPNIFLQGEKVGLDDVADTITQVAAGSGDVQIETRVGALVQVSGTITLGTAAVLELQYVATAPVGGAESTDLGVPLGLGEPEIYARLEIRRR